MNVGCFALIEPFESLSHQLKKIAKMGFKYADITDSHPGASIGRDAGFTAQVSLDDNPYDIKRLFERYDLTIPTFYAHARLLDPSIPSRYSTSEIMKAIKVSALMGIPYVITTEGEPHTEWGKKLTYNQMVFVIAEKLYEPLKLADDLGIMILLEPHGPITDSIKGIKDVINMLDEPKSLGINLDTGNSWLGGTDPLDFAKVLKDNIKHVHWKDIPSEWVSRRGLAFGC